MTEERIQGIIGEVKDNLYEQPPNVEGIIDIADQLGLSDDIKK